MGYRVKLRKNPRETGWAKSIELAQICCHSASPDREGLKTQRGAQSQASDTHTEIRRNGVRVDSFESPETRHSVQIF